MINSTINNLKKFWKFLQADSWQSLIAFFIIAIIFIKLILFPFLSLVTGSALPLVIVESCSMYHDQNGIENTISKKIYKESGVMLDDTKNWDFKNGLNKGDVIFVMGVNKLKKGDVIIFNGGASNPIIHRLVKETEPYATYGDNNPGQLSKEKAITENQIMGKAIFKIPYVGWIKLIFFEHSRSSSQKGFCK